MFTVSIREDDTGARVTEVSKIMLIISMVSIYKWNLHVKLKTETCNIVIISLKSMPSMCRDFCVLFLVT